MNTMINHIKNNILNSIDVAAITTALIAVAYSCVIISAVNTDVIRIKKADQNYQTIHYNVQIENEKLRADESLIDSIKAVANFAFKKQKTIDEHQSFLRDQKERYAGYRAEIKEANDLSEKWKNRLLSHINSIDDMTSGKSKTFMKNFDRSFSAIHVAMFFLMISLFVWIIQGIQYFNRKKLAKKSEKDTSNT